MIEFDSKGNQVAQKNNDNKNLKAGSGKNLKTKKGCC